MMHDLWSKTNNKKLTYSSLLQVLSILQQKKEENSLELSSFVLFVRLIGLEPTRLSTPDPKSGASTNFATGAWCKRSLFKDSAKVALFF